MRSKRKPLWERFEDNPSETYLALELKVIDDQIAECNQQIRHYGNNILMDGGGFEPPTSSLRNQRVTCASNSSGSQA